MATSEGDKTTDLRYKCFAADNWSLHPAKSTVSMDCNGIKDIAWLSFCDSDASIANNDSGSNVQFSGQFVFAEPPQTSVAPTTSTQLVNKEYADSISPSSWSTHPAITNVDISCNRIINTESISFCDTSYIGPGSSFDISSNSKIVIQSAGPTIIAKITIDGTADVSANRIIFSTAPQVSSTTVDTATQLVPRTYVDTLISRALPATAGYLPGTCYNIHKNVGKNATAFLAASTNTTGLMIFLYPLVDTVVRKVITVPTTGNTTGVITTAGFSLIEFANLSDITGECVATTGNIASTIAPFAPWPSANTRYSVSFTSFKAGATSYTLQAGKKYAITVCRDPIGTVSTLLGLGFGTNLGNYVAGYYGSSLADLQSAAFFAGTITPLTLIPSIGSIVSMNTASITNLAIPLVGVEP